MRSYVQFDLLGKILIFRFILCMIFQEKYFACYIVSTEQI